MLCHHFQNLSDYTHVFFQGLGEDENVVQIVPLVIKSWEMSFIIYCQAICYVKRYH